MTIYRTFKSAVITVCLLFTCSLANAQLLSGSTTYNPFTGELDRIQPASPLAVGGGLEYVNNQLTLTDNCNDNELLSWDTATSSWVCDAAGGSGTVDDDVTVNSTAVDTTANFLDGDIDWTLADGGAGGPDNITGTLDATYAASMVPANETDPNALLTAGTDNVKDTHIDWGSGAGQVDSSDMSMARIGASTYSTVQHMQDIFHSTGLSSGGTVTDAGSGNINIAAGTGFIRATNSSVAQLSFFDFSAQNGVATTANQINYVYVQYNAGTPNVAVTTTYGDIDRQTEFVLATVVNQAGTLYISNSPHAVGDHANGMIERSRQTMGIRRDNTVGGLILGETGTRNITLSAGGLWDRLARYGISALDTSVTGSFDTYTGATLDTAGATQWDNANYNNGGVKTALTSGRYANLWFYTCLDDSLVMLYGTSQFTTAAQAQAATAPSTVPNRVTGMCILAGRLLFNEGDATAIQIDSAFTTAFAGTAATDHGNLAGLADDDHTQYLLATADNGDFSCTTRTCTTDADAINALTEIDQGIKTAANDASGLVVGGVGGANTLAKWNSDGSLGNAWAVIGSMQDGKYCKYSSSGTIIDCNMTCVDITGSADLCDGSDDGGVGGGGDNVTVNSTAADTTANVKDTATVTWALVDGGAGGPDDVQATAVDLSCTDCINATEIEDIYALNAGDTLTGELVADDLGIEFTPGDTLTDCSTFAATGGGIFYDDSEGKFKKCQDNTLTDLDTGGAETNSLETLTTGILDDEIPVGTGADTVVYKGVGDCDDTGGNHLNYDTTTNAFSCGTSSSITDQVGTVTNGNFCTGDGSAVQCTTTQNAGTNIANDLEEETHGSEHDGTDGDYVTDSGDTMTGNLTMNDGTTDSPQAIFTPQTGTAWSIYTTDADDDLNLESNTASTENVDIINAGAGVANLTVDGTINAATALTEGGNAVYNSTETPGGELGGTWASPTIDDSVTVTGWVLGTSSATQLTSPTVIVDLLDANGAVDMDYGSADVTDHTFTTDSTGDAEIVLPADSIGPAEIDSTTGAYDFGGVTSLEVPNGTGPTVDATGEIAVDTTTDQLIYYGGSSKRVIVPLYTKCIALSDATNVSGTNYPVLIAPRALTIVADGCRVEGTSATIDFEDATDTAVDGAAETCSTTTVTWDTSMTGTATLTEGEVLEMDVDASSAATRIIACVKYTITAD